MTVTAAARTILDDASTAAMLTTLGRSRQPSVNLRSLNAASLTLTNARPLRYGNGVWMIATGSTTAYRSTDGVTWSTVTVPAGYVDFVWFSGASLWIGVGSSVAGSSPDGSTWTARTIDAEGLELRGYGRNDRARHGFWLAIFVYQWHHLGGGYGEPRVERHVQRGNLRGRAMGLRWRIGDRDEHRRHHMDHQYLASSTGASAPTNLAYCNGVFLVTGSFYISRSTNGSTWTSNQATVGWDLPAGTIGAIAGTTSWFHMLFTNGGRSYHATSPDGYLWTLSAYSVPKHKRHLSGASGLPRSSSPLRTTPGSRRLLNPRNPMPQVKIQVSKVANAAIEAKATAKGVTVDELFAPGSGTSCPARSERRGRRGDPTLPTSRHDPRGSPHGRPQSSPRKG